MRNYLMILLILFGSLKPINETFISTAPKYPYLFFISMLYNLKDFRNFVLNNKEFINTRAPKAALAELATVFSKIHAESKYSKNEPDNLVSYRLSNDVLSEFYSRINYKEGSLQNIPEDIRLAVDVVMKGLFSDFKKLPELYPTFKKLFVLSTKEGDGEVEYPYCYLMGRDSYTEKPQDEELFLNWKNEKKLSQYNIPRYLFVMPSNPNNVVMEEVFSPAHIYGDYVPTINPKDLYEAKAIFRYTNTMFKGREVFFLNIKPEHDWVMGLVFEGKTTFDFFDVTTHSILINWESSIVRVYAKKYSIDEALNDFAGSLLQLSSKGVAEIHLAEKILA